MDGGAEGAEGAVWVQRVWMSGEGEEDVGKSRRGWGHGGHKGMGTQGCRECG